MSDTVVSGLPGPVPGAGAESDPREHTDGLGGDAFADFIGLRHLEPGVARLTIRPELVNGGGMLVGPVGFALVDYTMGSLLWSRRNPGEAIATINIAINFVQSSDDGEVECRSTLDRRNRHLAVLSSQVHHEDGRQLITAVGSFSIFVPRHPRAGPVGGHSLGVPDFHLPSTAR